MHILLSLLMLILIAPALQAESDELGTILQPHLVADNVYYFKGALDARSYENYSLNNNMGFVVTGEGVVLIDSGASYQSGPMIAKAIATVTDKPVRWVINTGSQDHRWMGNGYFVEQGAEVIALARTVATQRQYADAHMRRSAGILQERLDNTVPKFAKSPVEADRHALTLGGTDLELIYAGDAHFPGDIMIWLPKQQVVFSGDVVYVDRLTGIHPWSNIRGLQSSFQMLESLAPRYIVPGHGSLCGLDKAKAESGDYYDFLIEQVGMAVEDFVDLVATVDRLADAPQFAHLRHYDSWHRLNINRVYLQLEAGN